MASKICFNSNCSILFFFFSLFFFQIVVFFFFLLFLPFLFLFFFSLHTTMLPLFIIILVIITTILQELVICDDTDELRNILSTLCSLQQGDKFKSCCSLNPPSSVVLSNSSTWDCFFYGIGFVDTTITELFVLFSML